MIDVQLQPSPLPMCSWRAHIPAVPVRSFVDGLRRLGFRSTAITPGCVQFVHDALGALLWVPATGRLELVVPYGVPRERRVVAARAMATMIDRALRTQA